MTSISSPTNVTDPLGRDVLFSYPFFLEGEMNPIPAALYQLLIKAVESPSCLIELPDGSRYYFGLISQNFTTLLEIVQRSGVWLVQRCVKNPLPADIQILLQKGKFIPGGSLD